MDLGGYSALGNAAGKKHKDIVAILLARGADPNQAIAKAKQDHDNVAVFLIAEARASQAGQGRWNAGWYQIEASGIDHVFDVIRAGPFESQEGCKATLPGTDQDTEDYVNLCMSFDTRPDWDR